MRLPTYDEIARVEEQLEVYETPFDESLFVVGPPGSGKTVLAVHRARMLAGTGTTVVVVTYNRMLRRLVDLLTDGQIKARTMHSFVSRRYRVQTKAAAPQPVPYKYDWEAMSATLDGLGVKPSPIHVIVDEAQDLPKGFFQYLRDFTAITITVFADEDQALTEERSTLRDIKVAAGLDDPILLTGNHRNTPEIARVAEQFHSGSSPIPDVHREPSGELPRIISYRTATAASERIGNWYKVRGGRVGVVVVNNRAGADIHAQLRNLLPGQRVDFYSGDEQNENDIDLLEPGITILNEKSIKGQEFDTVFIMEIDKLLPYTNDVGKRVMYMLCARARDNLILMYRGEELSGALAAQLPSVDILERP